MKAKQLSKAKVLLDPLKRTLATFIHGLTDLAQPKASLSLLGDAVQLDAFQLAIKGALQELPGKLPTCPVPARFQNLNPEP